MKARNPDDSIATFAGGRNGMIFGALAGASVFSLFSLVLDMLGFGAGGPGMAAMAGMAFGGLLGTLGGALALRHGGHGSYGGADRRFRLARTYPGPERRGSFMKGSGS